MRALDLFCGAGGAAMGLSRAGFGAIRGVDIKPQPDYPFVALVDDACAYLRRAIENGTIAAFDLIWASPPCQRYSAATRQSGKPDEHPDLVDSVRELLKRSSLPYIIENVIGSPLVDPVMLCGSMFGIGVVRHRLFECSFDVGPLPPHRHKGSIVTGEYITVAGNGGVPAWTMKERERRGLPRHIPGEMSLERWQIAMGIDWMERRELVQAIPPAYSEFLGRAALRHIQAQRRAA